MASVLERASASSAGPEMVRMDARGGLSCDPSSRAFASPLTSGHTPGRCECRTALGPRAATLAASRLQT